MDRPAKRQPWRASSHVAVYTHPAPRLQADFRRVGCKLWFLDKAGAHLGAGVCAFCGSCHDDNVCRRRVRRLVDFLELHDENRHRRSHPRQRRWCTAVTTDVTIAGKDNGTAMGEAGSDGC